MFEDSFGDVVEHATTLHDHDAAGDLVGFISGGEFLHGECAESMYAHGTHGDVSSATHVTTAVEAKALGCWPCAIVSTTYGTQSSGR